ncbi:hypothetical protein [Isoptericola rhizosphaerae]|uniref:hypothetical protein n=1 Tax=Isoptericola rhizosphaerae TaxID=3377837 RepID=UPI00383AB4B1
MKPTLSDTNRDRLTAAADGTAHPLTLAERSRWIRLERHYPPDDQAVIRDALTARRPEPDAPHRGAHGRREAARRFGPKR